MRRMDARMQGPARDMVRRMRRSNQDCIDALYDIDEQLRSIVNSLADVVPHDNDPARASIEQARIILDKAIDAIVLPD